MTIEEVIKEALNDYHMCNNAVFPVLNRCLNEHGYKANIRGQVNQLIAFEIIPNDRQPLPPQL